MVRDDEIDLRELLGALLDRKWLIAVTTALFMVIGLVYVVWAPPIYQAQAMVQVESKVPAIPGISDLASLGGGEVRRRPRKLHC